MIARPHRGADGVIVWRIAFVRVDLEFISPAVVIDVTVGRGYRALQRLTNNVLQFRSRFAEVIIFVLGTLHRGAHCWRAIAPAEARGALDRNFIAHYPFQFAQYLSGAGEMTRHV